MSSFIDLPQLSLAKMGIDLSGSNICVSQQLLDNPEIRPVFQKVGGKGVAQHVGSDLLRYATPLGVLLEDLPKPLARQPFAVQIQVDGLLPGIFS
jgi:hypothetical protein